MILASCFLILVNFMEAHHHHRMGWMMKSENGETIRTWATDRNNQTYFLEITQRLPKDNVTDYKFNECLKNGIKYNVYTYSREIE